MSKFKLNLCHNVYRISVTPTQNCSYFSVGSRMTKEEFWYTIFENMLRNQVVVLILKTSILFDTIIKTADWNWLFSLHGTGGLHRAQRWNAILAELELKRSCHSTSLMRVMNLKFLNVKSRNKRIGLDYWHS